MRWEAAVLMVTYAALIGSLLASWRQSPVAKKGEGAYLVWLIVLMYLSWRLG